MTTPYRCPYGLDRYDAGSDGSWNYGTSPPVESPDDVPSSPQDPYLRSLLTQSVELPAPYEVTLRSPSEDSLAGRVFGRQLEESQIHLGLARRLAADRRRIHEDHLKELDRQRGEIVGRLEFASRPYSPAPPQMAVQLERVLQQIESERQRVQRSYWKDMADVAKDFLASAFAYRATWDRYRLFGGLDRYDG